MTGADGRVDWGRIRLRPGDRTCPVHGIIRPAGGGLVPYCPGRVAGVPCMHPASLTVATAAGLESVPPRPTHCRRGHRLLAGRMLVGAVPCRCTPVGHHRTWTCRADAGGRECGDMQQWPPPPSNRCDQPV